MNKKIFLTSVFILGFIFTNNVYAETSSAGPNPCDVSIIKVDAQGRAYEECATKEEAKVILETKATTSVRTGSDNTDDTKAKPVVPDINLEAEVETSFTIFADRITFGFFSVLKNWFSF